MSYDKKLRIRLCFNLLLAVCGFTSIAVGLLPASKISDFSRGYFCGLGFSLLAGGAITIVKISSVLRDEEKLKAKRIKEEDERNTALNLTSSHIAFFSMIFLAFIATFYFAFKFFVENSFKVLNKLFLNDKYNLTKTGFNCIIYRVIDNGFAIWAKAINLFHASVTACHTCSQN